MHKSTLFALWAVLFIVCACLGFIPEPEGALSVVLTLLGAGFFAPPAVLTWRFYRDRDTAGLCLIRNLSAASLGLTLLLLLANFFSVFGSTLLGNILYALLVVISSPMVCSQYWVLSLFCWACLLMVSLSVLKRK